MPGVCETSTPKWRVAGARRNSGKLRGRLNEPDQVRDCPDTLGLAVVTPLLEPATYEKPAGRVSVMLLSVWATAPGLLMVTV